MLPVPALAASLRRRRLMLLVMAAGLPGSALAHSGPPLFAFAAYPTLLVYWGAAAWVLWHRQRGARLWAALLALALTPVVAGLAFFIPLFLLPDAALAWGFALINLALMLALVLLARRLRR